jgi:hypothetical protein
MHGGQGDRRQEQDSIMTMTRLAIALLLLPTAALAEQRTYRDAMGHEVGRSTTPGNTTTFTDSLAREVGRAIRDGNGNVTVYDRRQIGTITSKPRGRRRSAQAITRAFSGRATRRATPLPL